MKNAIRKALMLLFLAVFLFSAWQVYGIYQEYRAGSAHYADLTRYASHEKTDPDAAASALPPTGDRQEESTAQQFSFGPQVDFTALSEINPDIVGWLYIEGTQIHYPVVQGADNNYYLNHRFDGAYNSAGCLFLDTSNQPVFSGLNNIIYGHQMKNGSMFSDLSKYKQQAFYAAHPTGWLITPSNRYRIDFFSGYVSDVNSHAWDMDFSEQDYGLWLAALKEQSCFSSDVLPTPTDRILTLSTCSYEFNDARFVVHGIMTALDADQNQYLSSMSVQ